MSNHNKFEKWKMEMILRDAFDKADGEFDGYLSNDECMKIFKKLTGITFEEAERN